MTGSRVVQAFPRDLLIGPVAEVAPRLLGALLISEVGNGQVALRLTEVEAYAGVGEDPGSHAHRGRTLRNATMFGPAGLCYIYRIYGMHWCANVVVAGEGDAAAVLLRAGEVVAGRAEAAARRPAARQDRDLARGPARLAAALGLDGSMDGTDLLAADSPVRLLAGTAVSTDRVVCGPRTGVSGAGAVTPWRYHVSGEPTVSPYRPAAVRTRRRASR